MNDIRDIIGGRKRRGVKRRERESERKKVVMDLNCKSTFQPLLFTTNLHQKNLQTQWNSFITTSTYSLSQIFNTLVLPSVCNGCISILLFKYFPFNFFSLFFRLFV